MAAPSKGKPATKLSPAASSAVRKALAARQGLVNSGAIGGTPTPGSATATAPAGNGKYAWGTGKPTHTISAQQHALDMTPLDAPQSYQGALAAANAQGDLQYGPQITAAQQLALSTPAWFRDYQAQVAGYKSAALAQSQPLVAQAQQLAAPATDPAAAQAQVPQGLDPSSDAGKASVLAAQGRAALAALGAQALGGEQQATQDYLTGQGANAARALPEIQAGQQQQIGALQGQRGQVVSSALDTARTNAQNYAVARGTLGLNTEKAASDATQAEKDSAQAAKDKRAARAVTKRGQDISSTNAANRTAAAGSKTLTSGPFAGYSQDAVNRHSQKWRDERTATFNRSGDAGKAQEHVQSVRDASGKELGRLDDIQGRLKLYKQDTTPVLGPDGKTPVTVKDPKTGKQVIQTRPRTPAEIRERLIEEGFSADEIYLSAKIAAAQLLNADDVIKAHRLGISVPRKLIAGGGAADYPSGPGSGSVR